MGDFIRYTLTLLVAVVLVAKLSCTSGSSNSSDLVLKPVGPTEYRMMEDNEGSEPFQICLMCKCCPSGTTVDPSTCASMSCCFGIDCQLPNKPYGVCAFVPKTCNCTSCAV